MEEKKLEIGIVGVGSIGIVMAVQLANAGYNVEVTKKSQNDLVIDNRVNLEIHGAFGSKTALVPYVQKNKFTTKKDVLFILTQAYSVGNALEDAKQYLKPNGIVVTIQNVLSTEHILKSVGAEKYLALVIDWNANRQNPSESQVIQAGGMHIGVFDESAKVFLPILKKMLDAVAPTIIENDMYGFIASRFILNCCTSSLSAITGFDFGKTLKEKRAQKIMLELMREQIAVFNAFKVAIPQYDSNFDYYLFTERSISGWNYRRKITKRLIKQNGHMVGSLLRALENKKQSEKDYLCREIVSMAKLHNMSVPYNEAMANMIDEIADGSRGIYMENINDKVFTIK